MYKDIPRSGLLKSPLSKKFLKFYNHGQSFISYKSNFILDGFLFFPIDENTFTCSDLFCHFEKVNYKKFNLIDLDNTLLSNFKFVVILSFHNGQLLNSN